MHSMNTFRLFYVVSGVRYDRLPEDVEVKELC
jgi:hypothetical protein